MKSLNIQNDSNNNQNTENNASNSMGTSTARLQNLTSKLEESKGSNTETPNPKKAPINYIDNMGEWKEAQKKYEEEAIKKQQELTNILGTYEDKTKETDRFRTAKTELEIKLIKITGAITDKLDSCEDFLTHIYTKIYKNNGEINTNIPEKKEEEDRIEEGIGNLNEKNGSNKTSENDKKSLLEILTNLGIEYKIVPQITSKEESIKGRLLSIAIEEIIRFLGIVECDNREINKKSLNTKEIEGINIYTTPSKNSATTF